MKCNNKIIEVNWRNGKKTVNTVGTVTDEWLSKINATYDKKDCNGTVECKLYADASMYDSLPFEMPEITIIFKCNNCGKEYHLDIAIQDIEKYITESI